MPTFVALMNFTEQGVQKYKETRKRADSFGALAEKFGVTVRQVYWLLGEYDGLLILDSPDEHAVTAAMLHLASLGNVRTRTLRAFTGDEMGEILSRAPRGRG